MKPSPHEYSSHCGSGIARTTAPEEFRGAFFRDGFGNLLTYD